MAEVEGGGESKRGRGQDIQEGIIADVEGFRRRDATPGEAIREHFKEGGRGFCHPVLIGEDDEFRCEEAGDFLQGSEGVGLGVGKEAQGYAGTGEVTDEGEGTGNGFGGMPDFLGGLDQGGGVRARRQG